MNTMKMVRIGMMLGLFLSHNAIIIADEFIVDANGMLIPARGVGQSSSNSFSSGEQHIELVDETTRRTAAATNEEDETASFTSDNEEGTRRMATRRHPKAVTPKGNGYGNRPSRKSEAGTNTGISSGAYAAPLKRGKGNQYSKSGTSKSEDGYKDQHRPPHPSPVPSPTGKHKRPYPRPTNKGGYNWKQGPIFGNDEGSDDDESSVLKFANCFVKVPGTLLEDAPLLGSVFQAFFAFLLSPRHP